MENSPIYIAKRKKKRGHDFCSVTSKTVIHIGHEMCFTVRYKCFYFETVVVVANIQRVTLENRAETHVGLHVN